MAVSTARIPPSKGIPEPLTDFSQDIAEHLVAAARELGRAAGRLRFSPPVAHVYNPLDYAWAAHEQYLRKFARAPKRVVFLGMNPGPFGMMQTGVPFGEVAVVREWLKIEAEIGRPRCEHPKRRIQGLSCPRSEVSGSRLWGLFASEFGSAEAFFERHLVVNYCPLVFLEDSGRNRTPDKLAIAERLALGRVCDAHLAEVIRLLRPQWLIGIGGFAVGRARLLAGETGPRVGQILHPSPASPAANRGWAVAARKQLRELGVWP